MVSIFDLTDGYKNILELIRDGEENLEGVLKNIDDAIEVKADGYANIIATLDGDVYAIKQQEERLAKRRKTIENNIKNLKRNLEICMIETNKRKFKTNYFSFNIQKNPPSLKVYSEEDIPQEYFVIERVLQKRQLLNDIKNNGLEVEGVEIVQGESLRIR